MSRLNDVIGQVIEHVRDASGVLNIHNAVKEAIPLLDDEDREHLVSEALSARFNQVAQRGRRAAEAAAETGSSPVQATFPLLRAGYPLATNGREVKLTESLSLLEFKRLISIREKSIQDDRAHLKALRDALAAIQPVWDENPAWTFGQVCAAYRRVAA